MLRKYHLSLYYLGQRVILLPRVPEGIAKHLGEEGVTPRICVAPSLNAALQSVNGMCTEGNVIAPEERRAYFLKEHLFVYVTNKAGSIRARNVYDAHLSGERWYLEPTEFRCLGAISHLTYPRIHKIRVSIDD